MKTNHARKVSEQAFNELVEAVEAGKSQKLVEYLKAVMDKESERETAGGESCVAVAA